MYSRAAKKIDSVEPETEGERALVQDLVVEADKVKDNWVEAVQRQGTQVPTAFISECWCSPCLWLWLMANIVLVHQFIRQEAPLRIKQLRDRDEKREARKRGVPASFSYNTLSTLPRTPSHAPFGYGPIQNAAVMDGQSSTSVTVEPVAATSSSTSPPHPTTTDPEEECNELLKLLQQARHTIKPEGYSKIGKHVADTVSDLCLLVEAAIGGEQDSGEE